MRCIIAFSLTMGVLSACVGCRSAPDRHPRPRLTLTISACTVWVGKLTPRYNTYARGDHFVCNLTIMNEGDKPFSVPQKGYGLGYKLGAYEHLGDPVIWPHYNPESPRHLEPFRIAAGEAIDVPVGVKVPGDFPTGTTELVGLFWILDAKERRTILPSEPVRLQVIAEWSTKIEKDAALTAAAQALSTRADFRDVRRSVPDWRSRLDAEPFRDGWRVGGSYPVNLGCNVGAVVEGSGNVTGLGISFGGCK